MQPQQSAMLSSYLLTTPLRLSTPLKSQTRSAPKLHLLLSCPNSFLILVSYHAASSIPTSCQQQAIFQTPPFCRLALSCARLHLLSQQHCLVSRTSLVLLVQNSFVGTVSTELDTGAPIRISTIFSTLS